MRFYKKTWLLVLLLAPALAWAQDTAVLAPPPPSLLVKKINIKGHRRTKAYIIEREMQFAVGDSILATNLSAELEQARQQIYNTTLFNEVKVTAIMLSASEIAVDVEVKERWYIFPVPQFRLVDRNINEWLTTFKGNINRINYGIKFTHYNLSGRRDQLRIFLLNGFTRNIAFSYTMPGSNPSLTEGFSFGAGYTQNRQVGYATTYNNALRLFTLPPKNSSTSTPGGFVRTNINANASYIIRKGIFNRHTITVNFNHFNVNDTVAQADFNPNYFGNGATVANVVDFTYNFFHNDVDNTLYPLKGNRYSIILQKRGFGLSKPNDNLSAELLYGRFWHLGGRWYGDMLLAGKIRVPFTQSYFNMQSLGYGENYLRGLEVSVIDALAYTMARNTLRYKLLSFSLPFPIRSKSHPRIPFTIFAKTFTDLGYAYTRKQYDTYLNNRLLYTGGFGIDVLTLYDFNMRFEYSFNQLGKKGLFLHTQLAF
jgi:outer membrane protein assembly factor BamA